jgi:tripartite-type tricarboxylate transporter receptor subunit TctC
MLRLVVSLTLLVASPAFAQSYPAKPVRIVVPSAAGGGYDVIGRMLADNLSRELGQAFVVENRVGAGTLVGTQSVAAAAPDGYTLLVGGLANMAFNLALHREPRYHPVDDFTPVAMVGAFTYALVARSDLPLSSLEELVAYARANPGKLNFGSSGPGSVAHLSGEMFKNQAKLDITHIAYKGGIISVQDLVAGHVQIVFSDALPAMQFIRSGKLRAIAVTGPERSPFVPDVPTCVESGMPGLVAVNWWGVLLPAGTPKPIVQKYHDDFVKVMQMPDVKQRFGELGVDAVSSTPEEFAAFMRKEAEKYAKLIKEADIKVEN